jgi:hypothetical protein
MAHDAERTTTAPVARSPAAERMRLHRERKRQGLRCLTIELRETEIDALIREGLLKSETRNDPSAVSNALYAFLDGTLDLMP